jgi:hypothetical protein
MVVESPRSLADDLEALTEALGDPVLDLEAVLSVLTDDLLTAIPSYLGMSITLSIDGSHCTLNSSAESMRLRAMASLWLPLDPHEAGGHVVFYARDSGAFADLAEDAMWMLRRDGQAVVDRHLTAATGIGPEGIHGLAEFGEVNQALGVLSAMGHQSAHAELYRRALGADRTILQTARNILWHVAPDSTVTE